MNQLLSRVQTWCGVKIENKNDIPTVALRGKPIARFPSDDTLEAVLCGSIRHQIQEDPHMLPDGVWTHKDYSLLLVDLTQPGGLEEAIRVLLNTYIVSESPRARDWWLSDQHLDEDPTCDKIAEVIREFRGAEIESDSEMIPAE